MSKDSKNKDRNKNRGGRKKMDPRMNCAARVCCEPPAAKKMQIELLCEAGCPDELAEGIADRLDQMGVRFAPAELMDVIAELADHPNRAT